MRQQLDLLVHLNKHAPLKQVSKSKQKQFQKPSGSQWEYLNPLKLNMQYLSNNPVKFREFKRRGRGCSKCKLMKATKSLHLKD